MTQFVTEEAKQRLKELASGPRGSLRIWIRLRNVIHDPLQTSLYPFRSYWADPTTREAAEALVAAAEGLKTPSDFYPMAERIRKALDQTRHEKWGLAVLTPIKLPSREEAFDLHATITLSLKTYDPRIGTQKGMSREVELDLVTAPDGSRTALVPEWTEFTLVLKWHQTFNEGTEAIRYTQTWRYDRAGKATLVSEEKDKPNSPAFTLTPQSLERYTVKSTSEGLFRAISDWTVELIRKLVDANHQTGWGTFSIRRDDTPQQEAFCFISWNSERSKQAKEVLEAAGLLCDTDLGPSPQRQYKVEDEVVEEPYSSSDKS